MYGRNRVPFHKSRTTRMSCPSNDSEIAMQVDAFYHQFPREDRLERPARKWSMASGSHVLFEKEIERGHGLAVEGPYLLCSFSCLSLLSVVRFNMLWRLLLDDVGSKYL